MNNFDSHALVPLDHLIELETAAYDNPNPRTVGDRIGSTVQTTIVCAALAGMVAASSFGVAKAADWLEERRAKREQRDVTPKMP